MKRFLPILAVAAAAVAVTAQVQWVKNDATRLLNRSQWKAEQTARQKAPARITQQWETLVEENFDKMAAGSNDAPDTVVVTHPYIADSLTHAPKWSGIGVRQAGGAVCVGNPGWGSCILNTPEMDMQGLLRLTLRAKALDPIDGFTINLDYNGIYSPGVVLQDGGKVSATDNGWRDFEFTFYNPKDVPCFLQIAMATYGTKQGVVIDDFKLERTHDYLPSVADIENYGFKADGFSAIWKPVANAQSYLVSLYAEETVGKEDQEKVFDLNGVTEADNQLSNLPEGISVQARGGISHFTADQGADGTPAIVLSKEDEWIEIDAGGARITNLLFWYRGLESDDEQAGFWQCQIDGWDGCKWTQIAGFCEYETQDAEGLNMDFGEAIDENNEHAKQEGGELVNFRGMYTRLRIHPESLNYGVRLAIDDIDVVTEPEVKVNELVKDLPVNVNEHQFSGVDMTQAGMRYFVGVKAVNGDIVSDQYVTEAFGVAAPKVMPATEVNKDSRSFMANWEAIDNADAFMVTLYDCQQMDKDMPAYTILSENFDDLHEDGCSTDPTEPTKLGNTYELAYFDYYTQNPGWTGVGNCAIVGALGCNSTWLTGMNFILTPPMTLNNAGGKYNVHVRAYMKEGDQLLLIAHNYGMISEKAETEDWYEWDFPMADGIKNDQIYIQSASSETFLIDDFTVTQDLVAGDLLLTPLKQVEAMDNSQAVDGAPEGLIGYDVMAGRQYYTLSAISDYSDTQLVDFDGNVAIDQALAPHAVLVVNGLIVTVTAPEACAICVYNVAGQLVEEVQAVAGANIVKLPAQGAYIVTVNGKAYKILAK